ncbi:hypothetical protein [Streptomyces griseus]|uniref:hypothetical protein n=1 Tax=Streptomyces griseus TaxID=1911 RepID=UPI0033A592DE
MVAVDPAWINGVQLDGVELRRVQAMGVMSDGTALGARGGVLPGSGGLAVSVVGSAITVGSGSAWVYRAGQGVYGVSLNSGGSHTLNAAHATLPRIDLVYLRVWDNSVDASGLNTADTVYLPGTASSTPSAPTPAGTQIYLPLATISVPASGGGSPSVNNTVAKTVAPGGILPDPAAAGLYAGQYRDDGTGLQRYDGTAWGYVQPLGIGRVLWGRKTANTSRANTATVTADPHMALSVVPGTYAVDAFVIYSGDDAMELRLGWTAPAGTTGSWWPDAASNAANSLTYAPRWGAVTDFGPTTQPVGAVGTSNTLGCRIVGTATVTTAGTLALAWAQSVSGATATVVYAHSHLRLHRVS